MLLNLFGLFFETRKISQLTFLCNLLSLYLFFALFFLIVFVFNFRKVKKDIKLNLRCASPRFLTMVICCYRFNIV